MSARLQLHARVLNLPTSTINVYLSTMFIIRGAVYIKGSILLTYCKYSLAADSGQNTAVHVTRYLGYGCEAWRQPFCNGCNKYRNYCIENHKPDAQSDVWSDVWSDAQSDVQSDIYLCYSTIFANWNEVKVNKCLINQKY